VKLKAPLPVYLGYWTARVAADGTLQFRRDVYGIDKRLTALLADRLAKLRRSADAPVMNDAPRTRATGSSAP
jgi:murein L,D-transpeptidase YcbB/YkuD